MDMKDMGVAINNFGAMVILALMVMKSPAILTAGGTILEMVINNLRGTQKETLDVFKAELDKMITVFENRFESIEKPLVMAMEKLSELSTTFQHLGGRVESLEHVTNKSSS